ncbi:MAG: DNA polymerase III subunit delta [Rhodospirillaceae bacterium]|nr:DNA polymerase III subunit delta [Rhodospirillaceae bacterium]
MEIRPAHARRFVESPDAGFRVFLLFGPDEGLIRERSNQLQGQVVEDPQDAFRLADLDGDAVNDNPALLYDEAGAMAFGGGDRVVKVRRLRGRIADAVVAFLKEPVGDARVILEAPGASKKTGIVKAAIGSKHAAAIPCYHDQNLSLRDLVTNALNENGLKPGPGVVSHIEAHAGSDRALTRQEIGKLALFLGASDPEKPIPVDLEQVQAVVGDTALLTIDSLVDAVFEGRHRDVERTLLRVRLEGTASASILRAASNHVVWLLRFQAVTRSGLDARKANSRMRPPVNFTRLERVGRQARLTPTLLSAAMTRLAEAEAMTRQTGMPDDTICDRALFGIAVAIQRR